MTNDLSSPPPDQAPAPETGVELTNARLAVNDWHACQTPEELERWRQAQNRLIDAARADERARMQQEHQADVTRAVLR